MKPAKKTAKAKAASKFKDLKAKKNPKGGVFNSSVATRLSNTNAAMGIAATRTCNTCPAV